MPMKCSRCGYEWESKIPQPKECPRCKGRLDYQPGPVGAPKILKKGGEKVMTSKLPLATAAVIIVVAAIGAWTIWGQAPAAPPSAPPGTPPTRAAATISVGTNVAIAENLLTIETSGIENVYIIEHHNYENEIDLANHENMLIYNSIPAVITESGVTVNIPYDTLFDIVVAITVDTDNVANLQKENAVAELTVSGQFGFGPENTQNDNEYRFFTDADNIRLNMIWDNDNEGYTLGPGGTISLDAIKLWLYK